MLYTQCPLIAKNDSSLGDIILNRVQYKISALNRLCLEHEDHKEQLAFHDLRRHAS